jgi:hypothetical protein
MRKIFLILTLVLFTGTIFGQQTLRVNLYIQKTTPSLFLKGSGGVIDFNTGNVTITHSLNTLTFKSGTILKLGTDTLSTLAQARAMGGGGGWSMTYPGAGIALSTGSAWSTSITNNSTNWNTAYTDRNKWDGGATGLTSSTGRTSLGATTVGSNIFTLANPSAISFLKINADNSVTARSTANTKIDLGVTAIETDLADYYDASATLVLKHATINPQTDSYVPLLTDDGSTITMNKSTATTLTVPLNSSVAFPIGTIINIECIGAGQTTVVATGGVTIISKGSKLAITVLGDATLHKLAINTWKLIGSLE